MPTVPSHPDAPAPPDAATIVKIHTLCVEAVEFQFEAIRLRSEFQALNQTHVKPVYDADDDSDPVVAYDYEDRWGFSLLGLIINAVAEIIDQPWGTDSRRDGWGEDHAGYVAELAAAGTPFGDALRTALGTSNTGARPAALWDRCPCGATAVAVYETAHFGDMPTCGRSHAPVAG